VKDTPPVNSNEVLNKTARNDADVSVLPDEKHTNHQHHLRSYWRGTDD